MSDIYQAFYDNTKTIIEGNKAGGNSAENKINEISAAIRLMEVIIGKPVEKE